jgi:hypothetical protein
MKLSNNGIDVTPFKYELVIFSQLVVVEVDVIIFEVIIPDDMDADKILTYCLSAIRSTIL